MAGEWCGVIDAAFVTSAGDSQNQTVNVVVVLAGVILLCIFLFTVLPTAQACTPKPGG
jgi:hypothetical protein